jgi:hypothetical protein
MYSFIYYIDIEIRYRCSIFVYSPKILNHEKTTILISLGIHWIQC